MRGHAGDDRVVSSDFGVSSEPTRHNICLPISDISSLYFPLLEIASNLAPLIYINWLREGERENLLQHEIDQVADLLDRHMGPSPQSDQTMTPLSVSGKWIPFAPSSSTIARERLCRVSYRLHIYVQSCVCSSTIASLSRCSILQ